MRGESGDPERGKLRELGVHHLRCVDDWRGGASGNHIEKFQTVWWNDSGCRTSGEENVVLSGGCFQKRYLTERYD